MWEKVLMGIWASAIIMIIIIIIIMSTSNHSIFKFLAGFNYSLPQESDELLDFAFGEEN